MSKALLWLIVHQKCSLCEYSWQMTHSRCHRQLSQDNYQHISILRSASPQRPELCCRVSNSTARAATCVRCLGRPRSSKLPRIRTSSKLLVMKTDTLVSKWWPSCCRSPWWRPRDIRKPPPLQGWGLDLSQLFIIQLHPSSKAQLVSHSFWNFPLYLK